MGVFDATDDFVYSGEGGLTKRVDGGAGDVAEVDRAADAVRHFAGFAEPLVGFEKGAG